MKKILFPFLAGLFLIGTASAFAVPVPTIHQVYAAAHSGHLRQAQQMMHQVLVAHPNSGKAHFVLAEILAGEHQFATAAAQLRTAQQLAPGLPFENPRAARLLQARIQQGLAGTDLTRSMLGHRAGSGMPWVVILLGVACLILLAVVIRALRRPRAMQTPYPGMISPNNMPGNMGTGPYSPMSPMGGGFMSSLKSGLGIGAGMAAGEALVDHFIDGNRTTVDPMASGQMMPPVDDAVAGNDLGGNDFGMNDDSSWSDDSMGGDDFSDFGGGDDGWN